MFVRLGKIIPFVLYLTILAACAPIVDFIAPQDFHVMAISSVLGVTPQVLGIGLLFLSFGFILLLWWGLYRNKVLFWLCSVAATVVYFVQKFEICDRPILVPCVLFHDYCSHVYVPAVVGGSHVVP